MNGRRVNDPREVRGVAGKSEAKEFETRRGGSARFVAAQVIGDLLSILGIVSFDDGEFEAGEDGGVWFAIQEEAEAGFQELFRGGIVRV